MKKHAGKSNLIKDSGSEKKIISTVSYCKRFFDLENLSQVTTEPPVFKGVNCKQCLRAGGRKK